ncbi:HPr family phosphocarrier protein [Arthrobacter sp. MA-N2]|uniref:HPr family phosphocarrier protein n=1 Tax=Arthrobacter sp. MA-N2 TaxID=1101188 RepID=UPI00055005A7|nr:HPr family phosphocarrier protein [Arthrobacter sp. MA-N2]
MSVSRIVTVTNPSGLHARPAAIFVAKAKEYESVVTLEKDGKTGSGKSLIGLLKLGLVCGSTVQISAAGSDARSAVEDLSTLLLQLAEDEGAAV